MPKTSACVASTLFAALLALTPPATAQLPTPEKIPVVQAALELIARSEPQTIETQIALCQIPSPPFKEAARAEEFRKRLAALGLQNVRIDSVGNVIAERAGGRGLGGQGVVLAGHLDTVFPEGTDVTVHRDGAILKGPGIEDNCRGLAIVLRVATVMNELKIVTQAPVFFVGTVGEEGPGNLRGVRHLVQRELKGRIGQFISVDADALNAVRDAVGSYRYTVTFSGPGGHSYNAFGMPNPMHAMGRAIAKIADFQVAPSPKTTFSVGIVEGGTTVNSIPAKTSFQIDMRSETKAALDELDGRFRSAVQQAVNDEKARWPGSKVALDVALDRWGDRPAATQPATSLMVTLATSTARALGFTPEFSASSTDANLPLSLGIPSLTIGGGGKATGGHSLSEAWDSTDSQKGTQWSLLLVAVLAGVRQ